MNGAKMGGTKTRTECEIDTYRNLTGETPITKRRRSVAGIII